MTVINRITGRMLARAALNWPEEMRDDMIGEWNAEVHAIGDDPRHGTLRRAWRRLRYGASLAATPPVDEPPGFLRRTREAVPAGGRRLAPFLALALAALVTPQLTALFSAYAAGLFGETTEGGQLLAPARPIVIAANALPILVALGLGRLLVRIAPISRTRPVLNAVAPVVVALFTILYMGPMGLTVRMYYAVLTAERTPLAVLTVGAVGLLSAGLVLIARERRLVSLAVTVLGGLVLLVLGAMAFSIPFLQLTGAGLADMARVLPEAMTTTTWASSPEGAALTAEVSALILELAALTAFGLAYAYGGIHARPRAAAPAPEWAPARREGLWMAWAAVPVSIALAVAAFGYPMPDPAASPGVDVWNLRAAALVLVLLAGLLSIPGGRVLKAGLGVVAAIMSTVMFAYYFDGVDLAWHRLIMPIAALFALLAWAGAVAARRTPLRTWVLWAAPATMAAVTAGAADLVWQNPVLRTWPDGIGLVLVVVVVGCATGALRWWHVVVTAVLAPMVNWPLSQIGPAVLQPYAPDLYSIGGLEHGYGGPPVLSGLLLGLALAVVALPLTSAPPPSARLDPVR